MRQVCIKLLLSWIIVIWAVIVGVNPVKTAGGSTGSGFGCFAQAASEQSWPALYSCDKSCSAHASDIDPMLLSVKANAPLVGSCRE
jgi:hypothetical protein